MKKLDYPQLQETLYYEQLPNGLAVYLLPKPGFQKTYASFATRYGSVDQVFASGGEPLQRVPDGIAHFLEHKMFEEPEGDIFATFAAQGASANAFTSFDRTVYLFSATDQLDENVQTLLDFVQRPYFTDANVEKEKGIIEQEIKMYADNPDWRVYTGLIQALYHEHPVRIDIAGSVESIRAITKEHLYACYNTFYHPSNMLLFVVGNIDPERCMALVRDNQAAKHYDAQEEIRRGSWEEPEQPYKQSYVMPMPVSKPKCMFGYKDVPGDGEDAAASQRRECETRLLFDTLLGQSSPLYQELYDAQLINDSFGYDYLSGADYGFSILGGETPEPEQLVKRVSAALEASKAEGLPVDAFERARKKRIGGFLRMMNSPEAIANEFTRCKLKGQELFALLPLYEQITLEQVQARLATHVNSARLASSIVRRTAT